jgi:hypothetical protein
MIITEIPNCVRKRFVLRSKPQSTSLRATFGRLETVTKEALNSEAMQVKDIIHKKFNLNGDGPSIYKSALGTAVELNWFYKNPENNKRTWTFAEYSQRNLHVEIFGEDAKTIEDVYSLLFPMMNQE